MGPTWTSTCPTSPPAGFRKVTYATCEACIFLLSFTLRPQGLRHPAAVVKISTLEILDPWVFCSFHTQPEPQVFEDLVGRRRRVGEDRHGVRCGPNAHRGGEEARLTSLGHGDVPGFMHKYMHAQNVHICKVAAVGEVRQSTLDVGSSSTAVSCPWQVGLF